MKDAIAFDVIGKAFVHKFDRLAIYIWWDYKLKKIRLRKEA